MGFFGLGRIPRWTLDWLVGVYVAQSIRAAPAEDGTPQLTKDVEALMIGKRLCVNLTPKV